MKILILNIDHPQRSVYAGAMAALLRQKIPNIELTGFITTGNEFLATTGVFSAVHFFATEAFFERTRELSSEESHAELLAATAPIRDVQWDVVVNMSANLLGPILINFLQAKQIKGISLDQELAEIQYSDMASFHLHQSNTPNSSPLHFSFLYRSMLKRYEDVSLRSVWRLDLLNELTDFVDQLKRSSGRRSIVLIDAGICDSGMKGALSFLLDLYSYLEEAQLCLPILLVDDQEENHPLIRGLREVLDGDLHVLRTEKRAKLSVVGVADLLITDSLHLKGIADVSAVPTILLTSELDLSDFSVLPGSMQFVAPKLAKSLVAAMSSAVTAILNKEPLQLDPELGDGAYVTEVYDHLPYIVPLGESGPEFARWWLGVRFFAAQQGVNLPDIPISRTLYKRAIQAERDKGSVEERGILKVALDLAQSKIKLAGTLPPSQVTSKVEIFLSQEERRLSSDSFRA